MSPTYRVRRRSNTQPLCVSRAARDPAIQDLGFSCFRLVATAMGLAPIELIQSTARMFAFVGRR